MDFSALLADLRDVAEKYKGQTTEPQVASTAYADMFVQILKKTQKMTDNYEDQITMLWVALNQLSTIYKDLSQGNARDQLTSYIFGMCARTVLNIQWSQLDDDGKVKKDFMSTVKVVHENLKPLGYEKFQLILNLFESQWTDPILTQIMASEDEDIEDAEDYIKDEDPEILKLRIEIMMKENCEEFALNLCAWSLKHPSLKEDLKIRVHQILILYRQQEYTRMQEVCSKIVCHDGIAIMSRFAKNLANQDLCIRLAQVFLIQDWITPDRNCCTQELLKLWIHHQYLADKDEERFLDSIWTVAKVCRSTDQIWVLIDGVRRECGDNFIQLYTELCKYALNIDKGNMEQETAKGNMKEVENRKKLIVRTCCRMAYMLTDYDFRMSRVCGLTAFSLIPTTENLNLVNKLYWTIKHTSVTSGHSKIDPATIYEVERLLGLMRPESLNPDYTWKQLIPVCKRYQLNKGQGTPDTSVKKEPPESVKRNFTKPNILSSTMPKIKSEIAATCSEPSKSMPNQKKQLSNSPRSLQRSHAEHLLAQNKNLSHEKVSQLAREKFKKRDEGELAEGPPLIAKELNKTINDLKKSIVLENKYSVDLAKKLSPLARKQDEVHQKAKSKNVEGQQHQSKVSLPSFQTIASKHGQSTSKGTFNILRPPGSANQECAKIAQHIAEMHEKQRKEKEALEHIRLQGKMDGAKFALNSRNIPSSSQISDLLALTLKDKSAGNQKNNDSDAMNLHRMGTEKPLKRDKGETLGGISVKKMDVTSHLPQKSLKTPKIYLATEKEINKIDSSGNLQLGDSKVPITPVFSIVVPKALNRADNQQQLLETVTNMVKNKNIPANFANQAVIGNKIGTSNSNAQITENNQHGNMINSGAIFKTHSNSIGNTIQSDSTVQPYTTACSNSMHQPVNQSLVQSQFRSPQPSIPRGRNNMIPLQLNQNSFQAGNIVMEVQNIAAVSHNTVPVPQSDINQSVINLQPQQYQQYIQSPLQTQQINQQFLLQPQQYGAHQSGYSPTVYQTPTVMSTQTQIHQQQSLMPVVQSNLQDYGSGQNASMQAYAITPNASQSYMQVQQTPNVKSLSPQDNYIVSSQNEVAITNNRPPQHNQALMQNQPSQMNMGSAGVQQATNKTGYQKPASKQFIAPPELSPAVVQQIFASLKQGSNNRIGRQSQIKGHTTQNEVDQNHLTKEMIKHLTLNKNDENVKKSVLEATQKILELRQQFGQGNEVTPAVETKELSNVCVPELPDLGSKEFEIDSILSLEENVQPAIESTVSSAKQQTQVKQSSIITVQSEKEMLKHIEHFLEVDAKSGTTQNAKKQVYQSENNHSNPTASPKQMQSTYLNANRIAKEREKTQSWAKITCKHCEHFFSDKQQLQQHIERNLCPKLNQQTDQEFSCSICKTICSSLNELKDHIKRSCRSQSKETPKPNLPLRDFEYSIVYKCTNCNWMNANEKISSNHVEKCAVSVTCSPSKHPAKLNVVYKCRMCSDIFSDKETIFKHVSKLCPHLKAVVSQREAQECINKLKHTNKLLFETNKSNLNPTILQGKQGNNVLDSINQRDEVCFSKYKELKQSETNTLGSSSSPVTIKGKTLINGEYSKSENDKEQVKSDPENPKNNTETRINDLVEKFKTHIASKKFGSPSEDKLDANETELMNSNEIKRLKENFYLEHFKEIEMKRKALKEEERKEEERKEEERKETERKEEERKEKERKEEERKEKERKEEERKEKKNGSDTDIIADTTEIKSKVLRIERKSFKQQKAKEKKTADKNEDLAGTTVSSSTGIESERKALKEQKQKGKKISYDTEKMAGTIESRSQDDHSIADSERKSGQEKENPNKRRKVENERRRGSQDDKHIAYNVKRRRQGEIDDRTEKGLRAKKHIKQKKYLIDEMDRKEKGLGAKKHIKQKKYLTDETEPIIKSSDKKGDDSDMTKKNVSKCKFCSCKQKYETLVKHYVVSHMVGFRPAKNTQLVCQFCQFDVFVDEKWDLIEHLTSCHKQEILTQVDGIVVRTPPAVEIIEPEPIPTRHATGQSKSPSLSCSPRRSEKIKKHLKALAMRKKCAENLQRIARKKLYTSEEEIGGEDETTSFSENTSETERYNTRKSLSKGRNLRRQSDTNILNQKNTRSPTRSLKSSSRMRSRSSSQSSISSMSDLLQSRSNKAFMLTRSGKRAIKNETDSSYVTESSNIEDDAEATEEEEQMEVPQHKRKLTRSNSRCSDWTKSTEDQYLTDSSDDGSVPRLTRSSGSQSIGSKRSLRDKSKKGEKTKTDKRVEKGDKKGKGSRQTSVSDDDDEYYSSATDISDATETTNNQKILQLKKWFKDRDGKMLGNKTKSVSDKELSDSESESENAEMESEEDAGMEVNYSLRKRQKKSVYREYESSDSDSSDVERNAPPRRMSPRQLSRTNDGVGHPRRGSVHKNEIISREVVMNTASVSIGPRQLSRSNDGGGRARRGSVHKQELASSEVANNSLSVLIGPDDDEFVDLKHESIAVGSTQSSNTSENKENVILKNKNIGQEKPYHEYMNVTVMQSDDEFASLQLQESNFDVNPRVNAKTGSVNMSAYNSEFQKFTSQRKVSTDHGSSESEDAEEEDIEQQEHSDTDIAISSDIHDVPVLPPKTDFDAAFMKFAKSKDEDVINNKLLKEREEEKLPNFLGEYENFFGNNTLPERSKKNTAESSKMNIQSHKKLFLNDLKKKYGIVNCYVKLFQLSQKKITEFCYKSKTSEVGKKKSVKPAEQPILITDSDSSSDTDKHCYVKLTRMKASSKANERTKKSVKELRPQTHFIEKDQTLIQDIVVPGCILSEMLQQADLQTNAQTQSSENSKSNESVVQIAAFGSQKQIEEDPDYVWVENAESVAEPRIAECLVKEQEVVIVTEPDQKDLIHNQDVVEHPISENLDTSDANVITIVEDCTAGQENDTNELTNIVFIELDETDEVIITHDIDVSQEHDNISIGSIKIELESSLNRAEDTIGNICDSKLNVSADTEFAGVSLENKVHEQTIEGKTGVGKTDKGSLIDYGEDSKKKIQEIPDKVMLNEHSDNLRSDHLSEKVSVVEKSIIQLEEFVQLEESFSENQTNTVRMDNHTEKMSSNEPLYNVLVQEYTNQFSSDNNLDTVSLEPLPEKAMLDDKAHDAIEIESANKILSEEVLKNESLNIALVNDQNPKHMAEKGVDEFKSQESSDEIMLSQNQKLVVTEKHADSATLHFHNTVMDGPHTILPLETQHSEATSDRNFEKAGTNEYSDEDILKKSLDDQTIYESPINSVLGDHPDYLCKNDAAFENSDVVLDKVKEHCHSVEEQARVNLDKDALDFVACKTFTKESLQTAVKESPGEHANRYTAECVVVDESTKADRVASEKITMHSNFEMVSVSDNEDKNELEYSGVSVNDVHSPMKLESMACNKDVNIKKSSPELKHLWKLEKISFGSQKDINAKPENQTNQLEEKVQANSTDKIHSEICSDSKANLSAAVQDVAVKPLKLSIDSVSEKNTNLKNITEEETDYQKDEVFLDENETESLMQMSSLNNEQTCLDGYYVGSPKSVSFAEIHSDAIYENKPCDMRHCDAYNTHESPENDLTTSSISEESIDSVQKKSGMATDESRNENEEQTVIQLELSKDTIVPDEEIEHLYDLNMHECGKTEIETSEENGACEIQKTDSKNSECNNHTDENNCRCSFTDLESEKRLTSKNVDQELSKYENEACDKSLKHVSGTLNEEPLHSNCLEVLPLALDTSEDPPLNVEVDSGQYTTAPPILLVNEREELSESSEQELFCANEPFKSAESNTNSYFEESTTSNCAIKTCNSTVDMVDLIRPHQNCDKCPGWNAFSQQVKDPDSETNVDYGKKNSKDYNLNETVKCSDEVQENPSVNPVHDDVSDVIVDNVTATRTDDSTNIILKPLEFKDTSLHESSAKPEALETCTSCHYSFRNEKSLDISLDLEHKDKVFECNEENEKCETENIAIQSLPVECNSIHDVNSLEFGVTLTDKSTEFPDGTKEIIIEENDNLSILNSEPGNCLKAYENDAHVQGGKPWHKVFGKEQSLDDSINMNDNDSDIESEKGNMKCESDVTENNSQFVESNTSPAQGSLETSVNWKCKSTEFTDGTEDIEVTQDEENNNQSLDDSINMNDNDSDIESEEGNNKCESEDSENNSQSAESNTSPVQGSLETCVNLKCKSTEFSDGTEDIEVTQDAENDNQSLDDTINMNDNDSDIESEEGNNKCESEDSENNSQSVESKTSPAQGSLKTCVNLKCKSTEFTDGTEDVEVTQDAENDNWSSSSIEPENCVEAKVDCSDLQTRKPWHKVFGIEQIADDSLNVNKNERGIEDEENNKNCETINIEIHSQPVETSTLHDQGSVEAKYGLIGNCSEFCDGNVDIEDTQNALIDNLSTGNIEPENCFEAKKDGSDIQNEEANKVWETENTVIHPSSFENNNQHGQSSLTAEKNLSCKGTKVDVKKVQTCKPWHKVFGKEQSKEDSLSENYNDNKDIESENEEDIKKCETVETTQEGETENILIHSLVVEGNCSHDTSLIEAGETMSYIYTESPDSTKEIESEEYDNLRTGCTDLENCFEAKGNVTDVQTCKPWHKVFGKEQSLDDSLNVNCTDDKDIESEDETKKCETKNIAFHSLPVESITKMETIEQCDRQTGSDHDPECLYLMARESSLEGVDKNAFGETKLFVENAYDSTEVNEEGNGSEDFTQTGKEGIELVDVRHGNSFITEKKDLSNNEISLNKRDAIENKDDKYENEIVENKVVIHVSKTEEPYSMVDETSMSNLIPLNVDGLYVSETDSVDICHYNLTSLTDDPDTVNCEVIMDSVSDGTLHHDEIQVGENKVSCSPDSSGAGIVLQDKVVDRNSLNYDVSEPEHDVIFNTYIPNDGKDFEKLEEKDVSHEIPGDNTDNVKEIGNLNVIDSQTTEMPEVDVSKINKDIESLEDFRCNRYSTASEISYDCDAKQICEETNKASCTSEFSGVGIVSKDEVSDRNSFNSDETELKHGEILQMQLPTENIDFEKLDEKNVSHDIPKDNPDEIKEIGNLYVIDAQTIEMPEVEPSKIDKDNESVKDGQCDRYSTASEISYYSDAKQIFENTNKASCPSEFSGVGIVSKDEVFDRISSCSFNSDELEHGKTLKTQLPIEDINFEKLEEKDGSHGNPKNHPGEIKEMDHLDVIDSHTIAMPEVDSSNIEKEIEPSEDSQCDRYSTASEISLLSISDTEGDGQQEGKQTDKEGPLKIDSQKTLEVTAFVARNEKTHSNCEKEDLNAYSQQLSLKESCGSCIRDKGSTYEPTVCESMNKGELEVKKNIKKNVLSELPIDSLTDFKAEAEKELDFKHSETKMKQESDKIVSNTAECANEIVKSACDENVGDKESDQIERFQQDHHPTDESQLGRGKRKSAKNKVWQNISLTKEKECYLEIPSNIIGIKQNTSPRLELLEDTEPDKYSLSSEISLISNHLATDTENDNQTDKGGFSKLENSHRLMDVVTGDTEGECTNKTIEKGKLDVNSQSLSKSIEESNASYMLVGGSACNAIDQSCLEVGNDKESEKKLEKYTVEKKTSLTKVKRRSLSKIRGIKKKTSPKLELLEDTEPDKYSLSSEISLISNHLATDTENDNETDKGGFSKLENSHRLMDVVTGDTEGECTNKTIEKGKLDVNSQSLSKSIKESNESCTLDEGTAYESIDKSYLQARNDKESQNNLEKNTSLKKVKQKSQTKIRGIQQKKLSAINSKNAVSFNRSKRTIRHSSKKTFRECRNCLNKDEFEKMSNESEVNTSVKSKPVKTNFKQNSPKCPEVKVLIRNLEMDVKSNSISTSKNLSQKTATGKNDKIKCSSRYRTVEIKKAKEQTEEKEDEEEQFMKRMETVKRARRKSSTMMQPYVSDFNFDPSKEEFINLNKHVDNHSFKVTKNDFKMVTRRHKSSSYDEGKDAVVSQETNKPRCNRDFTEEIKTQMRTRSRQMEGFNSINVPSPIKSIVTSQKTRTYQQDNKVQIFSPHIFTCDSVKKITRQQVSQRKDSISPVSSPLPPSKLSHEIEEIAPSKVKNVLKRSQQAIHESNKDNNKCTGIKPFQKVREQQSDLKAASLSSTKLTKISMPNVDETKKVETSHDSSESQKSYQSQRKATRTRSKTSVYTDSGVNLDNVDSPDVSRPDNTEKQNKGKVNRKSKEQSKVTNERLAVSLRKRTRVNTKHDDKMGGGEPVSKVLKPDGTSRSPDNPDMKQEIDMCKHEQLITKCDICSKNRRSRTTSPMPLYDNCRRTVRQIIHGGKVFEISKGSVTELEIQTKSTKQLEVGSGLTSGVVARGRTRGSKQNKCAISPQPSDHSEHTDLRFGEKRKNLNDYIHQTLNEIKKQRGENSQKWTIKKESKGKAPKFPYAFKKTR